jgi:hypothetical protein
MIFSAYVAGLTSLIGDAGRPQLIGAISTAASYAEFRVTSDQATWFAGTSMTSMPSLNLTPAMTFGN